MPEQPVSPDPTPTSAGMPLGTRDAPTLHNNTQAFAADGQIDEAVPIDRLGRFELHGEIGRGGMGAVFRGRDPVLRRELALKVLLDTRQDDPELLRRFHEEAQIGGQLQHPGLVPVYELGADADGRPFFAMKLIDGRTLAAKLKEREYPTEGLPRFLTIFEQVCQAVGYAHAQGVIHRDLKPANIMVGAFGEVQVMDWGLAKVLGSSSEPRPSGSGGAGRSLTVAASGSQTNAGSVMGTPAYMPPEQARGEIDQLDRRADVFALGAILCEILTGQPPYTGQNGHEILLRAGMAHQLETWIRLDRCGADKELVQFTKACLAAELDARPRDGSEVAAWVSAYRAGVEERLRKVELERAAAEARTVEERRRRRTQLALAGAVLLLLTLGGGGGWYLRQQNLERQAAQARQETERVRHEAELARAIDDDLNRLTRAQAEQKWDEAEKALGRAEGRLGQGGDLVLRQRVEHARADLTRTRADYEMVLAQAHKDQEMAARLANARLQMAELNNKGWDQTTGLELFDEAFAWYGLDVKQGVPETVAAQIASSRIREEIVTALDQWAFVALPRDLPRETRNLLDIAKRADPNPWRCELRQAMLEHDAKHVRRLAEKAKIAELSPTSIYFLANGLWNNDTAKLAFEVLQEGQRRYPGDFWINYQLALNYMNIRPAQPGEAVRYYTAALAARPDSVFIRNNLGNALRAQGKVAEAEAVFRDAIRINPDVYLLYIGLGNRLKEQGKLAEAVEAFHEALRLKPDDFLAHHNLGHALKDQGKLPEAIKELRESIRLNRNYAGAHLLLGQILYGEDKFAEAAVELGEAVRLNPLDGVTVGNFGTALMQQGKLPEAEQTMRRAIQLKPNMASHHFVLGLTLGKQGKYAEAETALRTAIRLQPNYPEARLNLGRALEMQGKVPEAVAAFREAMQLDPNNAAAHSALGDTLKKQGKFPEAAAEFREALRIKPDDAGVHASLGNALKSQGKLPEAAAELREALRIKPDDAGAHYFLGIVLSDQGKQQEAETEYRDAIRLNANHPEAHTNLGTILRKQGKVAEAIAEFREALRINPAFPEAFVAHVNLGDALNAEGKQAEALAEYREALRLKPDCWAAYNNLGNVLLDQGKVAEAVTAFRQATQSKSGTYMGYLNLGRALLQQGEFDAARAAFQRGYELGSRSPGWKEPSDQFLRKAERLVELDRHLPDILAGKMKPASAAEQCEFAGLCALKHRYTVSVGFYADAFRAEPSLAADLAKGYRYDAACYAVLATAVPDKDAAPLDDAERARLRKQSLAWLRADFAAWTKRLDDGKPTDRTLVENKMRHWQKDSDLVSVRDDLAELPKAERTDWQKLWQEVETLRKRAAEAK